ncbi:type I CRISPR-associated protein Cas7 [Rhodonellum sp.]|uniref:type I CRISPR-associated protein Cas7 n=1 Tax=Rhodonellum sp. TaxID=2231180 RepID=UPI002718CE19|nr:type I CRISPR-associated protein Cas7 [Rhodonellum sp.]MDO9554414.1 type I CRISPR-associated protein Cas7 [Rhodonellum sp.]
MSKFNKRAYGAAVIKSINSNYNADFTHQPRTLPDGRIYATDKALKYLVRNYLKHETEDKIFFYKTFKEDTLNPRSLDETYVKYFGEIPKGEGKGVEKEASKKREMLGNLLKSLDIRLFGGTYAGSTNLSLHGPAQITHGLNQFVRGEIYSEQIMSPFRNSAEGKEDSAMTTLGSQSKLREGHYVHGISVNPKNLTTLTELSGTDNYLSDSDIEKLKLGLRRGATYYDSSAKAGTDNELLLWVELKEGSKLVLPSFTELIKVLDTEKREIDLAKISRLLAQDHVKSELDKIEIYYNKVITTVINLPEGAIEKDL